MTPYWKRRVEGHRFLDWLLCFFTAVNLALVLFTRHPYLTHTRFAIAMSAAVFMLAAYRLAKGKRSDA